MIQLKAIFLQRALQLLQPLDLAGVARQRLIARRVDGHAARALLLGHITGRVGGRQQLFQRAALARNLDQSDRDPDVENLVLPDKPVVTHRPAHIIRNLPRLLQRTADQQHPELVAAEARHGIAVTHRIAQHLRHFPQHAVAGEMAAGVIHHLEAVEIEITQHVLAVAAVAAVDGLFQAAFEFAAIHQAGERIVRRLVRHLARQAAQLGHVVQQHDRANQLLGVIADRRGRQLDGALAAVRRATTTSRGG